MSFDRLRKILQWGKRNNQPNDQEECEGMRLNVSPLSTIEIVADVTDGAALDTMSKCSDEIEYYQWMQKATELRPIPKLYALPLWKDDPEYVNLLTSVTDENCENFNALVSSMSVEQLENISGSGQSLLHLICFRQDATKLETLLNRMLKVDQFSADGLTPLHVAVHSGWIEGVRLLLESGASSILTPEHVYQRIGGLSEQPILTAARNGDFAIATNLIEKHCALNVFDQRKNSLLHLACYSHCLPLVERLFSLRIFDERINMANTRRETPLHSLLSTDRDISDAEGAISKIAIMLLRKGAKIDSRSISGKTPLFLATRAGLPNVVRVLLEWRADVNIGSAGSKTVLHAACRAGSPDALKVLLESGKVGHLVCKGDDAGFVPFHFAASSSSIECCMLLLTNGEHLTNVDLQGLSRFEYAIRNMPNGVDMLRKVFDSQIRVYNKNKDDTNFDVEMDFSVLLSNSADTVDTAQQSLIDDFDDNKAFQLLDHPLVESFLHLKWKRINLFFYSHVVMYLLFLCVHSFYVIKTYCMFTDWSLEKRTYDTLYILHIILLILLSMLGLLYILADLRKYVKQFETPINLISIVTSALVIFSKEWGITNSEVTRDLAAISIFMCWIEFMMLVGRIPCLGIYVFMFTKVSKSVIKFLVPFTSLLLAFTFSFSVLFSQIPLFQSPIAFVKTLMMMIGEIDYTDIFEQTASEPLGTRIVGHCFLVVFLFLIPILLANLLIGLAVNDLPDLHMHGNTRRLVKQASYLVSYEKLSAMLRWAVCWKYCPFRVLIQKSTIARTIIFSTDDHESSLPLEILHNAVNIKREEAPVEEYPCQNNVELLLRQYRKEQIKMEKKMDRIVNLLENLTKSGEAK